MTYAELLALIDPANAYTFNQQTGGGSEGYTSTPTTVPGAYMMDPSNPMAGYVWDGGGGALSSVIPREGGGVDWTQYGAGGQNLGSGFSQDTSNWYDSLLRAGLVLGGGALAGNFLAPALGMGGGAAGGGTAAGLGAELNPYVGLSAAGSGGAGTGIAGAIDGMMSAAPGGAAASLPSAATTAATTAASVLPRLADGSVNWSQLLSNPALLAAGAGAAMGIAGNGDMNSSQNSSSSNTQGLAPWLQGHASDFVNRAGMMSYLPQFQTNNALDTGRGLLSNTATQGDPLVNAARGQQANVIGGGLLNSNPYIDQVAGNIGNRMGEAYATGTRAGTFSAFNNDGNSVLGKSAFGQTLGNQDRAFGDALGSTMSNLYMGNYNQERAAQDNASRASLGFGQFATNNAQNLYNMGTQDWQRPFSALQFYGNAINPAFGSQTTGTGSQTQNIQAPNSWMAALGGGALGAGMARSIFGGR